MTVDARTRVDRAVERAYGWFGAPRDSAPMCAARAALGLVLFCAHLQYLPYFDEFYSPHGIGGHDTIARHQDFPGIVFQWFTPYRVLHLIGSETVAAALYGLLIASAACFMVGFRPRVTGVLAGALQIVFNAHNPKLDSGWAWLMGPFILYLTLCDSGSQLSVDAWLRRRRAPADPGPAGTPRTPGPVKRAPWGMRLLQVHLCTMYLVAGFGRVNAKGWRDGEMVMRSLLNTDYGRFDLDWLALAPALAVVNYAVVILEPAAPFLLWLRGVGRYWALALMAMHLTLEIMIDAGWWQPMMMGALLTFLPAQWIRLEWLRNRRRRVPSSPRT